MVEGYPGTYVVEPSTSVVDNVARDGFMLLVT